MTAQVPSRGYGCQRSSGMQQILCKDRCCMPLHLGLQKGSSSEPDTCHAALMQVLRRIYACVWHHPADLALPGEGESAIRMQRGGALDAKHIYQIRRCGTA